MVDIRQLYMSKIASQYGLQKAATNEYGLDNWSNPIGDADAGRQRDAISRLKKGVGTKQDIDIVSDYLVKGYNEGWLDMVQVRNVAKLLKDNNASLDTNDSYAADTINKALSAGAEQDAKHIWNAVKATPGKAWDWTKEKAGQGWEWAKANPKDFGFGAASVVAGGGAAYLLAKLIHGKNLTTGGAIKATLLGSLLGGGAYAGGRYLYDRYKG